MKPFDQPPFDPHGDERSQEPFTADLPHKAPSRVYGSRRMLLFGATLVVLVGAVILYLFVIVPNLPDVHLRLDDPFEKPHKKADDKK